MISVSEATEIILHHHLELSTERVSLSHCIGRVLRENLIADRDFPPFDRVTMDGIAIAYESWEAGIRSFKIQEIAAAGEAQKTLKNPKDCIEIMTGAILPEGCDTVIRYEDLKIHNHIAEIPIPDVTQGQNIHQRGIDRKEGDVIVKQGIQLSAAEIGVAATTGKSSLQVNALPKIAVISTGDELVDIDDVPLPHQIRKSNVHQITAVLEQYGATVKSFHIPDDAKEVEKTLKKILAEFDAVILSGGVSAGKFDYVPDALENLGVKKLFHQVAQRPGKPFWFGISSGQQPAANGRQPIVFALPGNPVSSFMCTIRYIIPWLEKTLGIPARQQFAVLTEDVTFKPAMTYFLQVKLEHHRDGHVRAHPVGGHGSGDLANLVDADAFLELQEGGRIHHAGGSFRVWGWR